MSRESLYRFVALPALTAHESWFSFMPSDLVSAARNSALGTLVLSRLLARHAELQVSQEINVPAQHRWILQEASGLLALAHRVGAISMGAAIAANISRERVRALKDALGAGLYREALEETTLRIAQPGLTQAEAIPSRAWVDRDALNEFMSAVGSALIIETLPADGWLRRRVALKLPRTYADRAPPTLSGEARAAVAAWLQSQTPSSNEVT